MNEQYRPGDEDVTGLLGRFVVKKILVAAIVAGAGVAAWRIKGGKAEAGKWAEATDRIK